MTDKTDKTGGPAFPQGKGVGEAWVSEGGMTMRGAFAISALQGLLANPGGPIQANNMSGWGWCNSTAEDVANLTYSMADAMLKERSK